MGCIINSLKILFLNSIFNRNTDTSYRTYRLCANRHPSQATQSGERTWIQKPLELWNFLDYGSRFACPEWRFSHIVTQPLGPESRNCLRSLNSRPLPWRGHVFSGNDESICFICIVPCRGNPKPRPLGGAGIAGMYVAIQSQCRQNFYSDLLKPIIKVDRCDIIFSH